MNQTNYQRVLDETIQKIADDGCVPKLLLHSCCAPCSSYVLEYLSEYFDITDFYYNPNISPKEEYLKRTEELRRFIQEFKTKHPVQFLKGTYEPELFYQKVKGMEKEPEGGKRCEICFTMRLFEAARIAKEQKADYFTTTLSISPLKNAERLNQIGEMAAQKYGVAYLHSDFKKKGGYLRSIALSKEYHLYRQDYCGCIFSKEERERQKERQNIDKQDTGKQNQK